MASLTMEKKDWDAFREVLKRIPEQDAEWTKTFNLIGKVTDYVRLSAAEWSRLRKLLERLPAKDRDKKWKMAHESVDMVCETILDGRDMIKDPRGLDDEGPRDAEGNWP